jgi:TonB-linked SusC/RagA family outer membrane protein
MRKILQLFFTLSMVFLLLPAAVQAQERTVTGTIVSEDNKTPLGGVTVRVKGTRRIVTTDANGKFSIKLNAGETLQVSYVGYETADIKPGEGGTVGVSLKTADNTLGEVVVTAMDQKRNPRELGFSVQKVGGDEVKETQRDNFLNSLQGRVSGLTINPTSGLAGASSSIVLRGFNSMALDNQPLFVIDGVVTDNSTLNQTSNGNSGLGLVETSSRNVNETSNRQGDYTNRIADINPNDIESITVLKGPEATALYGSQASSGAIIITTKKGKADGKFNINYDNSFRLSKLTRFPEVQNVYGNGTNGVASSTFTTFGPKHAPGTKLYDNVDNFFETAFAQTHNLSVDYGKKNVTFRLSGSFLDQSGTVPQNKFRRANLRLTNTTKIGKFLELIPSVTYINSTNDKPLRGQNGYMLNLLIWPSQFDVTDWQTEDGSKKLLLASTPNGEIDNPFFSVNRNKSRDVTDRYIGTLGVNLTPFSWLTLSGRFGYDMYESEGYTVYNPLSFILSRGTGGSMDNYYRKYTGYNHTITATAKKSIGKFNFRVMGGTMWQDYKTEMYAIYGTNLVDSVNGAGKMVLNNRIITQDEFNGWLGDSSRTRASSRQRLSNAIRYGTPNYVERRQIAYFGEFAVNFRNYIFLSYTQRFETSSIFPKDFRNYNYPAGSISMIVSDMFPSIKKGGVLNYMKLRGSLASTARSSDPYRNQSVFNPAVSSGGGYVYGIDNNNQYLEPEIQKTYEIGTEMRLFKSKLSFDITYYNTRCEKQIFQGFRASYGTGFILNTLNIGTTKNTGVEISLGFSPVSNKAFTWDTKLNFNKMFNKVVSLPANVSEVYLSDTWPYLNARGGLIVGGPTTSITAFGYLRNSRGDVIIEPSTGLPISDGQWLVRGDRNPDFTLGWINNMRYKNWKLSFLWDLKVGGDIFNATDQYLTINGRSKRTLDREVPRVIQGVLRDGKENTANPTPNTIVVIPYYNNAYYNSAANMPDELFVEKDVNWFRLRDLTLSYTFPANSIKRMNYLKSLGFFATFNDLILMTNYTGPDPSVSANSASVRGVGGWGFDYGNAGAPVSFNFGIRAGF